MPFMCLFKTPKTVAKFLSLPVESVISLGLMPNLANAFFLSPLTNLPVASDKRLITRFNPVPAFDASKPLLLKIPIALAVSDKLKPA